MFFLRLISFKGLPILLFVLGCQASIAQTDVYKGLRISLFSFEVGKKADNAVTLKCNVANTGRLDANWGKKEDQPSPFLLVELDSISLPDLLKGHENQIIAAVKKEKINLAPGEIAKKISLKVKLDAPLETPAAEPVPPSAFTCPDIVFDTIYIQKWTSKSITLHYTLHNVGQKKAELIADGQALGLNAYFSAEKSITSGAILADGVFVQKGKETLDGYLLPGQKMHGEISISMKNHTRFSPNLILEIDPFQMLKECDKTNNTFYIQLEVF